mmetsp:Transcript_5359/g.7523  ORF Transcript_5359/g.7523 Transcript_5359/m.7523 type:complete len:823 (-) Transcript_5359:990-3458(-)
MKISAIVLFFGIIFTLVDQTKTALISVQPASVLEGDFDPVTLTFTFTRDSSIGTSQVLWTLTNRGTATNGVDLDNTTSSGTVNFVNNVSTATLDITIFGDVTVEHNETVIIDLSLPGATSDSLAETNVTGTILDNDIAYLSVSVGFLLEGNTSTTPANFTINTTPSDFIIQVNYSTADGTDPKATAGVDYYSTSGQVTFQPGQTEKIVVVQVIGDTVFENEETFSLVLSDPIGAEIDTSQALCTISNDDTPPNLSINNVTVSESAGYCTFTLTLDPVLDADVYFLTSANSGTATNYYDFIYSPNFFYWPKGQSTFQINVTVLEDNIYETNETFTFTLSQSNAVLTQPTGTCTIIDDDSKPVFSVKGSNITEGSGNILQSVNVFVYLSNPSEVGVSFNYSTSDGTASNTSDYVAITNQQGSFGSSQTSLSIPLFVVGDDVPEGDEYFFVKFSVEGATIANSTARVNILTDEDVPYITGYSTSVPEPDGVSSTAIIKVNLTKSSTSNITVQYSVVSFTATSGSDFTPVAGTLQFLAGEVEKNISITVLPDTLNEINEQAQILLLNPVNAGVTETDTFLTIVDDDPEPTLVVSNLDVAERGAGENTTANLAVSLSTISGRVVTIDYKILNGTATLFSDYIATAGTVSINPGTISSNIPFQIIGDDTVEPDETFLISLFNGNGVSGNATVTVTILNDDFKSSGSSGGNGNTATIIIAVVVPFAALGIAGVVIAVIVDRRRRAQRAEQLRLAEIEAQRSGTGTRRRVAVRRKKNTSPDVKTDDEGSVLECTDSDIDSDDYISEEESNVSSESDASEPPKENNNNKPE